MKINNNISAVISNKHLLRNEGYLSISMEKLSSGYKINHSGDNPSGMAISSKMRAQIRGLDRASQNASDGMSVLETADGALNEVTDMIQRMRELSVQAANGTNSESDRRAIQDEIDQLVQEVDRVAETTEFNTKKLLDGSLDKRIYTDGLERVTLSDEVPAGTYEFSVDAPPTQASLESGTTWTELATALNQKDDDGNYLNGESFLNINGTGVILRPGLSSQDIYTLVRQTAELGEAEISDYDGGDGYVEFYSIARGDEASMDVQMDPTLASILDFTFDEMRNAYNETTNTGGNTSYVEYTRGTNAVITLNSDSDFGRQVSYMTLTKESGESASRSVDGRRIQITDVGGFQIDFLLSDDLIEDMDNLVADTKSDIKELRTEIKNLKSQIADLEKQKIGATAEEIAEFQEKIEDYEEEIKGYEEDIEDYENTIRETWLANKKDLAIEVTDVGPMNLQIGANEGQQMTVRIDSTKSDKMYLDQVDVSTARGATRALEQLDEALSYISGTRATIGAYTNRLEHAVKSLDQTSENMNQAISRIEDVDMATEMTEYTKYNVLQQAATSALSQANELPQTALQLLQ